MRAPASAQAESGDPAMASSHLSKRHESMAERLARNLFCRLVQRRRAYWAAHPEQHPSNRRQSDAGMSTLDARAMYSP